WHPFMSVILPLMLAEQVLVERPRLVGLLPRRVRRLGPVTAWVVLILVATVTGGYMSPVGWPLVPVVVVLSAVVVWLVVRGARRTVARPGSRPTEIADVLPRGAGLALTVAVVAAIFVPFII